MNAGTESILLYKGHTNTVHQKLTGVTRLIKLSNCFPINNIWMKKERESSRRRHSYLFDDYKYWTLENPVGFILWRMWMSVHKTSWHFILKLFQSRQMWWTVTMTTGIKKLQLTHPEVVHDLDCLLKLYRDVHGDVVVETRTRRELLWERRPVVFPAWNRTIKDMIVTDSKALKEIKSSCFIWDSSDYSLVFLGFKQWGQTAFAITAQ